MQKDKYNNNKKRQKVERQKNSKKLDNKSEKKSVFTVNSHSSLILNSFTFYFKFFLPNS